MAELNINLDFLKTRFARRIDQHLASLRNILVSIRDGNYSKKGEYSTSENILKFRISLHDTKELIDSEKNKCFKDIVGSMIDLMDELIAIQEIVKGSIKIPEEMTQEKLIEYVNKLLFEKIQKISQDKGLSNIQKISKFRKIEKELKESLENYVFIRNSIEHHKGIANKDMILRLRYTAILFKNIKGETREAGCTSEILEAGESVLVDVKDKERIIKKGERISLSEEELDMLAMNLKTIILGYLIESMT